MKRTPIAATLLAAGIFVLSLSLGACSDDDGDDDYVAVTSITLSKTTLSLEEGGEETLTATVLPENATNKTVTWLSDKTDVATVDSNGKVTAVAAGEATITAKAGEQTAKCEVTVTASEEIPVEPDPGGENEILFFVDSSEADFAAEKFAAGSDITDNSLFMLNATVAMETSFGKSMVYCRMEAMPCRSRTWRART